MVKVFPEILYQKMLFKCHCRTVNIYGFIMALMIFSGCIFQCEYQPISGKIRDIAWDADSKRIAVCGEGKE